VYLVADFKYLRILVIIMAEYRTHSFNKDWHNKVEEFIEENDLAFDSPKYFIKFCVNKYMEEHSSVDIETAEEIPEDELDRLEKRILRKLEDVEDSKQP